ncbi:MAG: DUF1674 domain-containing protein [Sphingomicrobium sp.]
MKRPSSLDPPDHLSPSPPVPEPDATDPEASDPPAPPAGEKPRLDPTRYGDWEKKGIAVDF